MASGETKNYDILTILGRGTFGDVYQAKHKNTGNVVAMKMIDLGNMGRSQKDFIGDLEAYKRAGEHENVVTLLSYEKGEERLSLYLEFCDGGNLEEFCRSRQVSIEDKLRFMEQMAMGLKYMHLQNLSHQNIKPTNLLVQADGEHYCCKVSDFGQSKLNRQAAAFATTSVGAMDWATPERFQDGGQDEKSPFREDVFAIGLVYYALFMHTDRKADFQPLKVKRAPLGSWISNKQSREEVIQFQEVVPWTSFSEHSDLYLLICQMLCPDPSVRVDIERVAYSITTIRAPKKLVKLEPKLPATAVRSTDGFSNPSKDDTGF